MVRQIFKGKVIAAAGPLPGQLTVHNLQQWTSLRKGRFSTEIDDDVTHILCTEEQFRKDVAPSQKKRKGLHIVHYDWFEFSAVEEKKLPEREYSMKNYQAQERAKIREKARREKAKRDGEKFVNTDLFHIYHDPLHFPYQVDITRDDEENGEKGQRYTLCLWESNAQPHLYWFTAKFLRKKGDSQPVYHRESPCSGMWKDEMGRFERFFKQKTDIAWEDRVTRQMTTPAEKFQYKPPGGGKPVGCLPHSLDYCLEINAKIRGLPWPPVEENECNETVNDLSNSKGNVIGQSIAINDTPITSNDSCGGDVAKPATLEHTDNEQMQQQAPAEETRVESFFHVSAELETGPSQSHHQPSLSPRRQGLDQDASNQYVQSDSCPSLDSGESPSPEQEEVRDITGLAIDSEGLGHAINRALRIPAISALDGDEEKGSAASTFEAEQMGMAMSFDFS